MFCGFAVGTRNGEATVIRPRQGCGHTASLERARTSTSDLSHRVRSTATAQRSRLSLLRLHTRTVEVVCMRLSELPQLPH